MTTEATQALACPRCAQALTAYLLEGGAIHVCPPCGGQWLDNGASQRLVRGELPVSAHALLRPADGGGERAAPADPYRSAATVEREASACPVCGAALVDYVSDAKKVGVAVRLDVCPHDGTWFDRGEAWPLLQAFVLKRAAVDMEVDLARRARETSAAYYQIEGERLAREEQAAAAAWAEHARMIDLWSKRRRQG